MSVKPYVFEGAVLTGSAAQQGTAVPTLTTRTYKAWVATNNTASPIALRVHLVPSGGTAVAGNVFVPDVTVPAFQSYTCPEIVNEALAAGGTVWALGNGLNFRYTAVDVT